MVWIWLGVVIALALIEVITTNLVTIWFIVSAGASMIVSLFIKNYFVQFLVFVLGGVLLLVATRKYLVKLMIKNTEKTNLDRVIGMNALVTEEINKNSVGEVKVDGKRWSAIATTKIKVGSTVKVLDIDGVKLKVEEINE